MTQPKTPGTPPIDIPLADIKVVKNGVFSKNAVKVPRERKPDWLKVALPSGAKYSEVKRHRPRKPLVYRVRRGDVPEYR